MRQYTTPDQTAKLIELGFAQPRTKIPFEVGNDELGYTYSIGELIEMLPDYINDNFVNWKIHTIKGDVKWSVGWDCFETEQFQWIRSTELIDTLYNMLITLKEEKVL